METKGISCQLFRSIEKVYSFCFGNAGGADQNSSRASTYKIDDEVVVEAPKTYSWDKRRTIDPRQYMCDGLRNESIVRQHRSIDGQQFIVQNCHDCSISLLDFSATVTVDDCVNCNILIGPCKGSVFIRDCSDCRMIIACQQFRTRDCKNMDIYLLCQTQPIIESSTQMRFSCLQLNYDHFQDQLDSAKISIFNNSWSKIHDFTPAPNGQNYSYSPEDANPLEIVPIKFPEGNGYNLRADQESSLVPLTLGKRPRPSKDTCFCLMFTDKSGSENTRTRCLNMIKHVSQKQTGCRLVCTAEVRMTSLDVERLSESKSVYNDFIAYGPILALELCGTNAASILNQFCQDNNCSNLAYISHGQKAVGQLKEFYNYVDMQHGV